MLVKGGDLQGVKGGGRNNVRFLGSLLEAAVEIVRRHRSCIQRTAQEEVKPIVRLQDPAPLVLLQGPGGLFPPPPAGCPAPAGRSACPRRVPYVSSKAAKAAAGSVLALIWEKREAACSRQLSRSASSVTGTVSHSSVR